VFLTSIPLIKKQSPNFETNKEPKNRFQRINSTRLSCLAGRYDNPIPTRFLAPIDCLKIPSWEYIELYVHIKLIGTRFLLSSYWTPTPSHLQLSLLLTILSLIFFVLCDGREGVDPKKTTAKKHRLLLEYYL
jgi:hypothetical protein